MPIRREYFKVGFLVLSIQDITYVTTLSNQPTKAMSFGMPPPPPPYNFTR